MQSPSSDGGAEWGVREEKIVFAALKPLLDKECNIQVPMEVGMPRFYVWFCAERAVSS